MDSASSTRRVTQLVTGNGRRETVRMYLGSTDDANELLARDPLALLIGMLLDQQVPMEKAFTSPAVLAERMGADRLDAGAIAAADPERLVELFRSPPALHRYPKAMAERTQAVCAVIDREYGGDASGLWRDISSGRELVTRLGTLPGFGTQKARIFAALLGKQFGVQPAGWREACGDYGKDGYRSIADVTDASSLAKVRETKQASKAAAKAAAAGKADAPARKTATAKEPGASGGGKAAAGRAGKAGAGRAGKAG